MAEAAKDVLNLREFQQRSAQTVDVAGEVVEEAKDAPVLVPRDLPITLRYRVPETGQVQAFALLSRMPTFQTHLRIARMEVEMAGGRPLALFAVDQQQRLRMLARVTHQLVDTPTEVSEWIGQDEMLLSYLYEQCVVHETLFFRSGAATSGAAQSDTGRVAVSSALDERLAALRAASGVGG